MDKQKTLGRRQILKMLPGTVAGMMAMPSLIRGAEGSCELTPRQPVGPFYPVDHQLDENNDLTYVTGHQHRALGEVIYVQGQVRDAACEPVAGALIEIWQAAANGRYNHPGDAGNTMPLDPNFQYWGQAVSDAAGRYLFKTIKPGHYPAGPQWIRPPHIHFKLSKLGYHDLITQMYFTGNQYNAHDHILRKLAPEERQRVVIDFSASADGRIVGTFDITLEAV